jgi:hypothetical protein
LSNPYKEPGFNEQNKQKIKAKNINFCDQKINYFLLGFYKTDKRPPSSMRSLQLFVEKVKLFKP